VDRCRTQMEAPDGTPPPLDTPGGTLWLIMVGNNADRQRRAGNLNAAEATYDAIRTSLEAQPDSTERNQHLAVTYHQLGYITRDRGDLTTAEGWYRKSLTIKEQLGDRPGMAKTYHQLGMVAHDRGDLDSAEDWYRKSLTINEKVGNRPGMARNYGQLGVLAETKGQPSDGLEYVVRCVALFNQFPHPASGPGPHHLVRMTRQLGIGTLAETWRKVTDVELPQAVKEYVQQAMEDGQ
jgi:tetratricopeptide (TPR) repeat protein